ncbi:LPXTG cell wall anchor domain-containing protein [Streptomyces aidingensis]|uniref:LPXTG-motif cell wall anchor domain-containing protein/MYXO-CTERM domain-containing protein n=1 Tax=Streptomyces aidingensis TaxID=910347 RepID=A0A1I1GV01_9ACTN|nr:LPXTG cell wall anchor domain-containing protein [Streptomyces aidingensis]SFC15112.1 LPXTG-motif cell wall anchor domain-containing protein/MYXO-CTERM domain-containing protein [Streptomyces aidingensis]
MRNLTLKGAFAASAAAALLAAGAAPAFATGKGEPHTYLDVPLHLEEQGETPISAEDAPGGTCPDWITDEQDGWHFVVPGKGTFKSLTVEFEIAGVIELDDPEDFGPPNAKHAYVATEVGDKLLSGSADIEGTTKDKIRFFNLSHACPGTPGETTGETTTGDTTEGTSGDTTEGTSGDTTEGTSGDTTEGTSGDTTEGTSGDTTEGSTTEGETTEGTSGETSEGTSTEGVAGGDETEGQAGGDETEGVAGGSEPEDDGGNLAETGSSAPVVAISVAAAALLGAGGYLVIRRRNAGGNAAA